MDLEEAYRILEVRPGAGRPEVQAAYRDRARAEHPDMGGAAAAFRAVHDAVDAIRAAGYPEHGTWDNWGRETTRQAPKPPPSREPPPPREPRPAAPAPSSWPSEAFQVAPVFASARAWLARWWVLVPLSWFLVAGVGWAGEHLGVDGSDSPPYPSVPVSPRPFDVPGYEPSAPSWLPPPTAAPRVTVPRPTFPRSTYPPPTVSIDDFDLDLDRPYPTVAPYPSVTLYPDPLDP